MGRKRWGWQKKKLWGGKRDGLGQKSSGKTEEEKVEEKKEKVRKSIAKTRGQEAAPHARKETCPRSQ